jgi:hypothetical protein
MEASTPAASEALRFTVCMVNSYNKISWLLHEFGDGCGFLRDIQPQSRNAIPGPARNSLPGISHLA